MKLTITLPDPKFKAGDFVKLMAGPDGHKVPVLCAITEVAQSLQVNTYQTHTMADLEVTVLPTEDHLNTYILTAQETVNCPLTGGKWIYPRLTLPTSRNTTTSPNTCGEEMPPMSDTQEMVHNLPDGMTFADLQLENLKTGDEVTTPSRSLTIT